MTKNNKKILFFIVFIFFGIIVAFKFFNVFNVLKSSEKLKPCFNKLKPRFGKLKRRKKKLKLDFNKLFLDFNNPLLDLR